jgi:hypothetical protein
LPTNGKCLRQHPLSFSFEVAYDISEAVGPCWPVHMTSMRYDVLERRQY